MNLNWPLMENNITRNDLNNLIKFLNEDSILTQSKNVQKFEEEWSMWLGVKYSVFVNSGSSANLLTMSALRQVYGLGEVIVPSLTWVSDIAAVIQCGFTPVFVDINPKSLCMDEEQVIAKLSDKTKAVFLTHVLGFNGLCDRLLKVLKEKDILLIEDVCESHGATHKGMKLGTFGLMSNFSFYYAHHMSTIEGGMVCTEDEKLYQILRMFRSHGMIRESTSVNVKRYYIEQNPELNPEFIFAFPAYNVRSTEINAVIGRSQLKRLDENNVKRRKNFEIFLNNLDTAKYRTNFTLEGSCNYAFLLVIKEPNQAFCEKVMDRLRESKVEFRRGTSGGGNQLRQPYLNGIIAKNAYKSYPNVEHIHFYGFYIGNYPNLPENKIMALCRLLNDIEI
jgi:CDP-4-dehydro-6-deoxyglucose reductase, E1